ncbi:MAG: DUF2225 domain-containing protein [Bacteroidales bacterium]|nr:DUF2225 domain-containing protein [Bacteroidales bacterium]
MFYDQTEFNKWMDENYLLMGKAHFYKGDYFLAMETFKYIVSEFPREINSVKASYIWMSRVNIQESRFKDAEETLTLINAEELNKSLLTDYYGTLADYYLKQKKLEKAIEHLEKAIDSEKKKKTKTRWMYLLAQLNKKLGHDDEAYRLYGEVIKRNPPYIMAFNAAINQAIAFKGQGDKGTDIIAELNKMLKDEKNKDFKDQIYYALANIYYKKEELDKAISYYQLSAQSTVDNLGQQSISYLALADIFYNRRNFITAQAYYDSSVVNLDTGYEGYDIILAKSTSLSNLVEALNEFNLQDSLQRLAALDKASLDKAIESLIQQVIKQEEEEKLRKQREMEDIMLGRTLSGQNRSYGNESSGGNGTFIT